MKRCTFSHIHVHVILISQRRAERESQFAKMSFSDADRVKWKKVLVTNVMSSDESGEDDGQPVFIVKKLPWRSECRIFLNDLMLLVPLAKQSRQAVKPSHVFPKVYCHQDQLLVAFLLGQ